MDNPIIVALDGIDMSKAIALAQLLKDDVWGFKVNDLFFQHGIQAANNLGVFGNVMLDGKFHDIPNTVENTTKKIAIFGHPAPGIVTIHASGGPAMIRAAVEYLPGKVAAVTVLTSLDEDACMHVYNVRPEVAVKRLASMAHEYGASFIVCSPLELAALKDIPRPKIVPGIRPLWYQEADDQARKMTPAEAMEAGAGFLVMGRPILRADDPVEAAQRTLEEIKKG
ncbi:hypothetical protein LCGC14_0164320 [marine sediment metagenome]|uniref:Orotidine 5'-phosphate decarboxylase n=1 Tax=marine sediment metagenome TaxID=412755 RepID=A0A0F9XWM5_9ZZZZ